MSLKSILLSVASKIFKNISLVQRNEKLEAEAAKWEQLYRNVLCKKDIENKVKSLNLPAAICAEFARLITIENEINITGSQRAEFLNEQLQHLLGHLRTQVEYACASGGMIFKPYVSNNTIHTACLTQEEFIPIAWKEKHLTGCLFWDYYVEGVFHYTLVEKQLFKNGIHTIECKAYVSPNEKILGQEIPLTRVSKWKDISPLTTIGDEEHPLDRPLFSYFRVPFGNQIDPKSPLGVPVFARAIDRIEDANKQWTYLMWEFEGGQLAVDVADEYLNFKEDSEYTLPQAANRLYRRLIIDDSNPEGYNVFSPALRDESLLNGLDAIKREIEFDCCLAYGTLSNPQSVDKTAEEIRSSKQRSYTAVCDMQAALETALTDYIYAIDKFASALGIAPAGNYDVQFNWGDGILEDTQLEQTIRLQEVNSGITRKEDYLMWRYGVTEEQAKEMLPKTEGVDSYFDKMELR